MLSKLSRDDVMSASIAAPTSMIVQEHRGCKVWRHVRTRRTRNRVSGAVMTDNTPLSIMYVAGPGIRMRGQFRSVERAIMDIDFQLDYAPVPAATPSGVA